MKTKTLSILRPVLFTAAGAIAGLVYYRFFACTNGCLITSSPISTSVYMAVIGLLISQLFKKDGET